MHKPPNTDFPIIIIEFIILNREKLIWRDSPSAVETTPTFHNMYPRAEEPYKNKSHVGCSALKENKRKMKESVEPQDFLID